jgi:hypothetical protein
MLADTEDWKVRLCFACAEDLDVIGNGNRADTARRLVDAAYEAGRHDVIGHMESDEVVEGGMR